MSGTRLGAVVGMLILALAGGAGVGAQQKPDGVIATQDSEVSGVQTDLLSVKRTADNAVEVRWRWRNTTDKRATITGRQGLKEQTYLLDPANKKKHLALTDAKGKVVGSSLPGIVTLKAKEEVSAWARFPAPPPDVDKVTVVITKTPPFEGVTIAK